MKPVPYFMMPDLPGHFLFVPGARDFPYELLADVVRDARETDIICEVGAFLGHGTCYIMELLQYWDTRAKFYAFDLFGETPAACYGEGREGQLLPWKERFETWARRSGGGLAALDAFQFYTQQSPARDFLYDYVQFPPRHAGDDFADGSVSFALLHQSQKPENVAADMAGWWPKIKVGGMLAVHGPRELQMTVGMFAAANKNTSLTGQIDGLSANATWTLRKLDGEKEKKKE